MLLPMCTSLTIILLLVGIVSATGLGRPYHPLMNRHDRSAPPPHYDHQSLNNGVNVRLSNHCSGFM